jgi:hypothetical protein
MNMYIVNIHVCDVWLPICLNSNKPIPWFDCYTQYTQLSPSDVLWPRGGSWSRGPASDPCRSGVGSLFAKTNVRPTVAGWNWFFFGIFPVWLQLGLRTGDFSYHNLLVTKKYSNTTWISIIRSCCVFFRRVHFFWQVSQGSFTKT